MSKELDELKRQEAELHGDFLECCQLLLDTDAAIREMASPIYEAGGQPVEYPHYKDVLQEIRRYLDRQRHQAGIPAHREAKLKIKRAARLRPTYNPLKR